MTHAWKVPRHRLILVGSAIALCCVPIQFARGQSGGGEGMAITGQTIQDNIVLSIGSPLAGSNGGTGLLVNSGQINGFTLTNSALGSIRGSTSFGPGGNAGDGIRFSAGFDFTGTGTISNVTINNDSGEFVPIRFGVGVRSVGIGAGDGPNGPFGGGDGGTGLLLQAANSINGVTINNDGTILGGLGGIAIPPSELAGAAGHGVHLTANGGVMNVRIVNSDFIMGGFFGRRGGNGVFLNTRLDLSGVEISNAGTIFGTYSRTGGSPFGMGGGGGHGIALQSNTSIDTVTLFNASDALVRGGDGGGGIPGGTGGDGLSLSAGPGISDFELPSQPTRLRNVMVENNGTIEGGWGGAVDVFPTPFPPSSSNGPTAPRGGKGGAGVSIVANTIENITISNHHNIVGGSAGWVSGLAGNGGAGGIGIALVASAPGRIENILIFNADNALVKGGTQAILPVGSGADGGDAIFLGTPASNNVRVANFGIIMGGDAVGNGEPGMGINTSGNLSGLVIDNWGTISAGAGTNPIAINLIGSQNILNLNGHSAVYGKINAINGPGAADSNILNINFTGISPAVKAQLQAAQAAQGVVGGKDANFTFTVRGVTYVIDPMVINLATKSYELQGLTANQRALGANLDSFTVNPTGDMLEMLNAVDLSGDVPLALDALSPQSYQIFGDIALAGANFTTLEIDARLNNRRHGSEPIDASGLRLGTSAIEHRLGLSGPKGRGGRTIEPLGTVGVSASTPEERGWGGFVSGTAVFGDVGGRAGLGDAEFTTAGILLGVDGKVTDSLVAGVLLGYNNTDSDLNVIGSRADVDTFSTGLYAGWNQGRCYANALAAYSHHDYDSRRVIAFPGFARTATSETGGDQFALNVDGGYDYVVSDKLTFGPFLGLQYVHLDVDGFNETGAGAANLIVGGQEVDSLRSRLGVRANFRRALSPSTVLATDFRVEWQHEFMDDSRALTGTFAGSGLSPFAVPTTRPGRDAALVGLGVNVTYLQNLTVFLGYDAQLGGSGDVLQSIRGGVKIAF